MLLCMMARSWISEHVKITGSLTHSTRTLNSIASKFAWGPVDSLNFALTRPLELNTCGIAPVPNLPLGKARGCDLGVSRGSFELRWGVEPEMPHVQWFQTHRNVETLRLACVWRLRRVCAQPSSLNAPCLLPADGDGAFILEGRSRIRRMSLSWCLDKISFMWSFAITGELLMAKTQSPQLLLLHILTHVCYERMTEDVYRDSWTETVVFLGSETVIRPIEQTVIDPSTCFAWRQGFGPRLGGRSLGVGFGPAGVGWCRCFLAGCLLKKI